MDFPKLSLNDVLNLTVEDVTGKGVIFLNSCHLTEEERSQCFSRLRFLLHGNEEICTSFPVDAKELAERLSRISPRRTALSSPAPSTPALTPTTPASPPMSSEIDLLREREAYEALVQDGCQPSHPLELGFKLLDEPREYKDIISYWCSISESGRMPFWTQLKDWKSFRNWQDEVRQYYVPRNSFSDYQQKVNERRQRHNLEGNANLLPKRIQQSQLDDWMEYQNYHIDSLEKLEVAIKNAKEVLNAAKRKLDKAGGPELENVLKQSNSDISLSLYIKNDAKLWEARKERESAEREVESVKYQFKAAESDSSKEISQRTQIEAASAKRRLENSKKSENQFLLIGNVMSATRDLALIKRDLERQEILLDWIEQQRSVIASRCATSTHNTKGNNNGSLAKQTRSRDPPNHSVSDLLPHNESSKLRGQGRPELACSDPILESEASKPIATKRTLSPQMRSVSRKEHQSAETPTIDPNVSRRRSKRIARLKEIMQANNRESSLLHPRDQASPFKTRKKVSRFTRSTNLHTYPQPTKHRLQSNENDGANHSHVVKVPLRRSTRVSKKPKRFCAG